MADTGTDSTEIPKPRRASVVKLCGVGVLACLLIAILGGAAFLWTLHRSENSAFLREQLLGALGTGLGSAHRIELGKAQLQLSGVLPVFSIGALDITQTETGGRATLDRAEFHLRPQSLWQLSPQAKTVEFEGLRVVLPASVSDPAAAMAEAKAAVHSTLGVMHAMFAIANRDTALRGITGRRIDIFRRDAVGREVLVQDRLAVELKREADRITVALHRDGAPEKAVFSASGLADGDAARPITLSIEPLQLGALARLLGIEHKGFSPELQISLSGLIEGKATRASLSVKGGRVNLPEAGIADLALDDLQLDLSVLQPGAGIEVTRLGFRSGEAKIEATGLIKANASGALDVKLKASEAQPGRLTPADSLLMLSRFELDGEVSRDGQSFAIRRLDFAKDAAQGQLSGQFSMANGGSIATDLQMSGFDLRDALRLWPVTVAPELRDWLIKHMLAGKIANLSLKSRLAGQVLQDAYAFKPLPDDVMATEYRIENLVARPIFDAQPIQRGVLTGRATGRKAEFTLENGEIEVAPGRAVALRNAEFRINDTAQHPGVLNLRIPFSGRIDSIFAFLATPTLKKATNPPTELAIQDGIAEGVVSGWLRMVEKMGPNDSRIEANADIRNLRIDPLVKGEKLENGSLQFTSRNGGVLLRGEARFNGTPGQIEWRVDPGKDPTGTVKLVLDDAARARRGADLRPALTGPVPTTVSVTLSPNLPPDVDIELDLTRAKIEGIAPGFLKRPGQAAKASFDYSVKGERQILDEFDLDLGGIAVRGKLELAADGQFIRADLATLKLSPGDNVRGTIEKTRNGMKLVLRGNAFDLRPFLRSFQSGRGDDGKAGDLDLDLQTTVLLGFNSEIIAGAEVQAQKRNGNLSRLAVRGRFGSQPLLVDTVEQRGDTLKLSINTGDGGSLVRFMDLYPRAVGGRMNAEIVVSPQEQRGLVMAWDFAIRGESFLRQYAGGTVGGSSGPMSQSTGTTRRSEDVQFQKLRAEFVRRPGRMEFSEAVMWGPAVGGNIEGYLDYSADRVDLKGALVPAYALNNMFAQLPLLGPIFGGSQYEGLFALPFVITGRASQPVLRTNALSVIAPGFLRKMFELQREDGPQGRRSAPPGRAPNTPQQ